MAHDPDAREAWRASLPPDDGTARVHVWWDGRVLHVSMQNLPITMREYLSLSRERGPAILRELERRGVDRATFPWPLPFDS